MGQLGPQGPQGPQGPEGPEGPEGPLGPIGDKGPVGYKGLRGKDGGIMGPVGPVGDKGPRGDEGLKGDRGDVGLNGQLTSAQQQILNDCKNVADVFVLDPTGPVNINYPVKFSDTVVLKGALNAEDIVYNGGVTYGGNVNYTDPNTNNVMSSRSITFNRDVSFPTSVNYANGITFSGNTVFNNSATFAPGKKTIFNGGTMNLNLNNVYTDRMNLYGTMKIPDNKSLAIMTNSARNDIGNIVFRTPSWPIRTHGNWGDGGPNDRIPPWY